MTAPVPLAAGDAAVAAVFLLLARTGARHRDRRGSTAAAILWLCLGAVAAAIAAARVGVLSSEAAASALFVGWAVTVPLWAAFAFTHTGRGPTVTRRRLLAAAAYVAVVTATTLYVGAVGGPLGRSLRVATSVLQVGLLGLGLFGVFLVARSAFAGDLSTSEAICLTVGGLGVTVASFSLGAANAAATATLPGHVTGFLAATAGGFALAAFRFGLFARTPGTGPLARRTVFEEMGEAVVVVGREGVLLDANAAAEDVLGVSVSRDAGRPAASVLGFDVAAVAGDTVTVRTRTGRWTFDVSRSALTDRRGNAVGASYLFRDVTDRRTREQRIQVLNRVLRHNLRNDLDAVRGFADGLADDADDAEAVAARIRKTASNLVEVGETVERADRLLAEERAEPTRVDLDALLAEIASDVRNRHCCEVAVTGSADATVRTERTVLRTALLEVVENAVQHNDRTMPSVEISVGESSGGVRVAVSDDGPGIPDRERAVLLDGEESPLRHGSGVGLWFVSWALARLGGDLDFEDEDAGSTVVLDVPDATTGTSPATIDAS